MALFPTRHNERWEIDSGGRDSSPFADGKQTFFHALASLGEVRISNSYRTCPGFVIGNTQSCNSWRALSGSDFPKHFHYQGKEK